MSNGTVWIALGIGVLAFGTAVAVWLSFAGMRRRVVILQGSAGRENIVEAVSRQVSEVRALRSEIQQQADHLQALTDAFRGALQRFAVHRYDAFEDMGGKLSFSAAFLNADGDGIVITCINGRQEARTYAKPVQRTQSPYNLSPEEQEAIRQALSGTVMA